MSLRNPESFTSCRQETWAGSSREVARDPGDFSHMAWAVQTMPAQPTCVDLQAVEGNSVLQSLMRRVCMQRRLMENEA